MHVFLLLIWFAILLLPAPSFSFPSKGQQDCLKCHTLKKEDAYALLKAFDKDIKVIAVKQSSAKYLWEVSVESKGKKGLLYIDLPKKHIISGSVIGIQGKRNLTQNRLSELNKVNVSQIPLDDALILGDRKAQYRVIVFDDPD
jgi:thiol:disulfide interchange protein DsbC